MIPSQVYFWNESIIIIQYIFSKSSRRGGFVDNIPLFLACKDIGSKMAVGKL
jgi:hypothetical protein